MQRFLGISKTFKHSFLFEHFQKSIRGVAFNFLVGWRLHSYNFIRTKVYYIRFSKYFPKFTVELIGNFLKKTSVTELVGFWSVDYSPVILLTHYVRVLPSYRSQSIDLLCKSILTGFYMRTTMALNGLKVDPTRDNSLNFFAINYLHKEVCNWFILW